MDPVTIGLILQWAPVAFIVAGAVTAATPTPKDDGILRTIRKVFDLIAFNFGHAKNAPDIKLPKKQK
jgi:hypothetical protein